MHSRKGGKTVAQRLLTETFKIHRFSILSIYYLPTDCDEGMFGKYCNESCGKCLNDEQCHHINGSCLNGCASGYRGINCTEGMWRHLFSSIHILSPLTTFSGTYSTCCRPKRYIVVGVTCL